VTLARGALRLVGLAFAARWGFVGVVVYVDAHGVSALSYQDAPEKVLQPLPFAVPLCSGRILQ